MPTAQGKEEIVLETAGGLTELLMNVEGREGGRRAPRIRKQIRRSCFGGLLACCLLHLAEAVKNCNLQTNLKIVSHAHFLWSVNIVCSIYSMSCL